MAYCTWLSQVDSPVSFDWLELVCDKLNCPRLSYKDSFKFEERIEIDMSRKEVIVVLKIPQNQKNRENCC